MSPEIKEVGVKVKPGLVVVQVEFSSSGATSGPFQRGPERIKELQQKTFLQGPLNH